MCGIIGAVSSQDVVDSLLKGLDYLEYRGYDSSGIATFHPAQKLQYHRAVGKVNTLKKKLFQKPLIGNIGIAHTRWATHGKPSEKNAHPQCANHHVAVVHNGIIENYLPIKERLIKEKITFLSETDTEVLPWLLYQQLQTEKNLLNAIQSTISLLQGSFASLFLLRDHPDYLIGVRNKSPLIIGLGEHETFLASDKVALLPFVKRFIYLEEGDIAIVSAKNISIYDAKGKLQNRPAYSEHKKAHSLEKGPYLHYMQKEIQEQPGALNQALTKHIDDNLVSLETLQLGLPKLQHIHLIACGSSYHAALVGRFWIEQLAGLSCHVEVASEFRYRNSPVPLDTLLIVLSQSGETADTLGVLRDAKQHRKYKTTLAICNNIESSLAREADWLLPIYAGVEISVAATKSFLTQLNALLLLAIALAHREKYNPAIYATLTQQLTQLPIIIKNTLQIENTMLQLAKKWQHKQQGLLIARGIHYPIALEAALKLKETAYIHIEACPAGELKHGTLALLTETMPMIILAPDNDQLSKIQTNIETILARGGQLIILAGEKLTITASSQVEVIRFPVAVSPYFDPFVYTIPLQFLAYHIALLKGVDVDQPRHLAKSVTVE